MRSQVLAGAIGLLLAAVLLLQAMGRAASWTEVAVSMDEKLIFYVDDESVAYDGPYAVLWIKALDKEGMMVEGKTLWYSMQYMVMDCALKEEAQVRIILYDRNEEIIGVHDAASSWDLLEWEPVAPDSMMEGVYEYVCPEEMLEPEIMEEALPTI